MSCRPFPGSYRPRQPHLGSSYEEPFDWLRADQLHQKWGLDSYLLIGMGISVSFRCSPDCFSTLNLMKCNPLAFFPDEGARRCSRGVAVKVESQ